MERNTKSKKAGAALAACLLLCGISEAQQLLPKPYTSNLKLNYVRTWDAAAPVQDTALLRTMPLRGAKQISAYFDGLGRPLQTVAKQASLPSGGSAADMIHMTLYDELGRELSQYLPAAANTTGGNSSVDDGAFKYNAFQQDSFFNKIQFPGENFYYSQTIPEASPLNRPILSMPAGNNWSGSNRGTVFHYLTNTGADSVCLWNIDSAAIPVSNGFYPAGQLVKNTVTDERGMTVVEFKDKAGKTLLKKVQIGGTANNAPTTAYTGWLCTMYVYDDLGNLRFVISPKGIEAIAGSWSITNQLADELCFRYGYDERNRMINKKVPGAGIVEMVYDARDRLVMTRDANMLANGTWLVTQYENTLNRPLRTGLLTSSTNRSDHAMAAALSTSYPATTSGFELLTETYYDDYGWLTASGSGLSDALVTSGINSSNFITSYNNSPEYAQPLTASAAVKSMVTGSKTKILGSADTYLYSVNIYDEKARVIQTQQTNITGGTDLLTTQYDFTGKPLRQLLQQYKQGANAQNNTILTQNTYDDAGRIATISKNMDGTGGHIIAANHYDALGRLQTKQIGNGIDTARYAYNIRGWLLGMNRDYVRDAANGYFGFELGYDQTGTIIAGTGYATAQYNGNISGTTWKSKGDGEKRKYDFDYDGANRLLKADFTQYSGGSFNRTAGINFSMQMGDGINAASAYDANGNILGMKQWGLKTGSSLLVDDLSYHYYVNSNKLQNVNDAANDAQTRMGDFRTSALHPDFGDKTNSTTDYSYDANGNLVKDLNKDLVAYNGANGIEYNHLNLPSKITVRDSSGNKGSIEYTYDAAGNKLKKVTVEGSKTTTTLYIGALNFRNDTLQYASHEEGRIRKPDSTASYVYDYFLKDHLGNTRAVLTEERKIDAYPAATMETAQSVIENALYSNIDSTRSALPPGYPEDSYTDPNQQVAKLNGNGRKIGPAILLKVMAGDSVNIRASSWYRLNGAAPGTPVSPLSDLLVSLVKNVTVFADGKVTETALQTTLLPPGVTDMLNDRNSSFNSVKPKAYLSWVLLDEQFKYVSASSGFEQVGEDTILTTWVKSGLPIVKNGYLYVYTGNESPMDVFFDNLQVSHVRGPLLEETHYYPFGLTMAGISSKAAGKLENRFKYNGIELDEDLGVNIYEAFYRNLDQQTGRFWQIDPKVDAGYESISPYASMYNNPIRFSDPLGDEGSDGIWGRIVGTVKQIASDGRDFIAGVGAAIADNNTFGLNSQRAAVGNAASNKGLVNFGMDVGDAISIVQGTAQAIIGGAVATTLSAAAPVTGGLSLIPAAGAAAIGLDGVAVGVMGVKNLVNQKDRVNSSSESSGDSKPYSKKEARENARQARDKQPASEDYAKYKAKELEKAHGKDARREAHDKKPSGAPDRTKKQLDDDYKKPIK